MLSSPGTTPYDLHFRLFGTPVRVNPLFWLVTALLGANLLAQGFTRFIELGPGRALSGFMKRIDAGTQMLNVADVPSLDATAKALAG